MHAAGCQTAVSPRRFAESLEFLREFTIGAAGIETAEWYAKTVNDLRQRNLLSGLSKPDPWIAAWALEHGCALAARNTKHSHVKRLDLVSCEIQ